MRNIKREPQDRRRRFHYNRLFIFPHGRHMIRNLLLLPSTIIVLSVYINAIPAEQELTGITNDKSLQQNPQFEKNDRNTKGLRLLENGQAVYTGEFFRVSGRKIQLLRSLEKVAVQCFPSQDFSLMNELQSMSQLNDEFLLDQEV